MNGYFYKALIWKHNEGIRVPCVAKLFIHNNILFGLNIFQVSLHFSQSREHGTLFSRKNWQQICFSFMELVIWLNIYRFDISVLFSHPQRLLLRIYWFSFEKSIDDKYRNYRPQSNTFKRNLIGSVDLNKDILVLFSVIFYWTHYTF